MAIHALKITDSTLRLGDTLYRPNTSRELTKDEHAVLVRACENLRPATFDLDVNADGTYHIIGRGSPLSGTIIYQDMYVGVSRNVTQATQSLDEVSLAASVAVDKAPLLNELIRILHNQLPRARTNQEKTFLAWARKQQRRRVLIGDLIPAITPSSHIVVPGDDPVLVEQIGGTLYSFGKAAELNFPSV